jgi:DNA-binding PadR family transcriptional regulator
LEEVVRLVVAAITEDLYGALVMEQFQKQIGRSFAFSTVHTTLYRLEEKAFFSSSVGEANTKRGGGRKCLFTLAASGGRALLEIQQVRIQLWQVVLQRKKFQFLGP